MQFTASIPPLPFKQHSVDVSIRIYASNSRYGADIQAVGHATNVSINLSPHDLAAMNQELQRTMSKMALSSSLANGSVMRDDLEQLATAGHWAYNEVFGHSEAAEILHQVLGIGSPSFIHIISEDFFLPWELMYPNSLDLPVALDCFWGFKYVISRTIVQKKRPGDFVSPEISVFSKPRLGLLTDELPAVETIEVPFFESLAEKGRIFLSRLRSLDPEPAKKFGEISEFKNFWRNSLDVAHFACHASYTVEQPSHSQIHLMSNFAITLMEMDAHELKVSGNPLVIMNACNTGNLNPLYTGHFAAAFLRFGARGVVATECAVPDDFAAIFAQRLFSQLLDEIPLGESLLATRRHFLKTENNPSGLLYAMYGAPSIRLSVHPAAAE